MSFLMVPGTWVRTLAARIGRLPHGLRQARAGRRRERGSTARTPPHPSPVTAAARRRSFSTAGTHRTTDGVEGTGAPGAVQVAASRG